MWETPARARGERERLEQQEELPVLQNSLGDLVIQDQLEHLGTEENGQKGEPPW